MTQIVPIRKFAETFEELDVYRMAYAVSLEIHRLSESFPASERFDLTRQIRRASKSICANIAEGFVKQGQSDHEFGRFLSIAIGSAGEMLVWINYCHDLAYISIDVKNNWRSEYLSIVKMLQKLRASLSNH